jgi:amino acid permease
VHEAGAAPPASQVEQQAPRSRLAIASLALGILGIASQVLDVLAFWLPIASSVVYLWWIGVVAPILALKCGWAAKREIDYEGTVGGRRIAIAGIVLGWIGVAIVILAVVLFLILISSI